MGKDAQQFRQMDTNYWWPTREMGNGKKERRKAKNIKPLAPVLASILAKGLWRMAWKGKHNGQQKSGMAFINCVINKRKYFNFYDMTAISLLHLLYFSEFRLVNCIFIVVHLHQILFFYSNLFKFNGTIAYP